MYVFQYSYTKIALGKNKGRRFHNTFFSVIKTARFPPKKKNHAYAIIDDGIKQQTF
jgi:hypothetical protein